MAWGRTPVLDRLGEVRQLRCKRRIQVRKHHRDRTGCPAAGLAIVVIFTRNIDETAIAQLHAGITSDLIALAITTVVKILPVACLQFKTGILAQAVVQHAANCVRPVLSRRTFAQDLKVSNSDGRNCRNVSPLRTEAECGVAAAVDLDQRRTVVALAVEHDEDVIGWKTAQRRRANEGRGIGNRVLADIERWDDVLDCIEHVGGWLRAEFSGADHIYGRCSVGSGAIGPAGSQNNNALSRLLIVAGCSILRKRDTGNSHG